MFDALIGAYLIVVSAFGTFAVLSISVGAGNTTQESLYLAGREMEEGSFEASAAATNVPLVVGLLFFLTLGASYGFLTVLALAIPIILPFVLFRIWLRPAAGHLAVEGVTLHELLGYSFQSSNGEPSKAVRATAALVSTLSFLLALGFELYLGGQILGSILGLPSNTLSYIGFALAGLTGVYSAIGGLRGVFRTDAAQYWLILVGVIAVLILLTMKTGYENVVWVPENNKISDAIVLVAGSLFFYPFWYLSSMDTWQRAAATANIESQGRWQVGAMVLIMAIYLIAGSAGSVPEVIETEGQITGLVISWLSSDSSLVRFISIFAISGIFSALLSTADTYSVMSVQALDVDIGGRDWRTTDTNRRMLPRRLLIGAFPFAAATTAWFVTGFVQNPVVLFYVAFGGQAVLFFPVVFAMYSVDQTQSVEDKSDLAKLIVRPKVWKNIPGKYLALVIIVGYSIAVSIGLSVSSSTSPLLYMAPIAAAFTPLLLVPFAGEI